MTSTESPRPTSARLATPQSEAEELLDLVVRARGRRTPSPKPGIRDPPHPPPRGNPSQRWLDSTAAHQLPSASHDGEPSLFSRRQGEQR